MLTKLAKNPAYLVYFWLSYGVKLDLILSQLPESAKSQIYFSIIKVTIQQAMNKHIEDAK
jgi:hypothetical protein